MKIDMTSIIKSITGEPFRDNERYDNPKFISTEETPDETPQHVRKKVLTLGRVCVEALLNRVDSDTGSSGVEKNKWFLLSLKIQDNDSVDLRTDEIETIKKRIGKTYNQLVIGRSYQLLDPIADDKKTVEEDG